MKIPFDIIGSVILPFLAGLLITRYLRRQRPAKSGTVCLPSLMKVLGAICAIPFLAAAGYTFLSGEAYWISAAFLLFACLGFILIIACVNCRIEYDDDGFLSRNFFGKESRYTYEQVTGIKESMGDIRLYMGDKKIVIDGAYSGRADFVNFVQAKYRAAHEGRSIPKSP